MFQSMMRAFASSWKTGAVQDTGEWATDVNTRCPGQEVERQGSDGDGDDDSEGETAGSFEAPPLPLAGYRCAIGHVVHTGPACCAASDAWALWEVGHANLMGSVIQAFAAWRFQR